MVIYVNILTTCSLLVKGLDNTDCALSLFLDTYSYNTGGWLPSINDKNQWIQVDMPSVYYYNQVSKLTTESITSSGWTVYKN